MDGRDQCFGFLYGERINNGAIFLANPNALESQRWVVFLRVVPVAEFECAPKDADRAVVGFLAPRCIISNSDEGRISDVEESLGTDPRTLESVKTLRYDASVMLARSCLVTREPQWARKASKTWAQVFGEP